MSCKSVHLYILSFWVAQIVFFFFVANKDNLQMLREL